MKVHTQHGTCFQIQCTKAELDDLREAAEGLERSRIALLARIPPGRTEAVVRTANSVADAARMTEALTCIKCPHCPTGRLGEPRSHKMDCTWRDPK